MRLATAGLLAALLLAPLGSGGRPAFACRCAGAYAEYFFEMTDLIVVADEDPAPGFSGDFNPVQVLKGEIPATFHVEVAGSYGNCPVLSHLVADQRHLLLLSAGPEPYQIGACNRSAALGQGDSATDELVAELRALAGAPALPETSPDESDETTIPLWFVIPLVLLISVATLLLFWFNRRRGGGH